MKIKILIGTLITAVIAVIVCVRLFGGKEEMKAAALPVVVTETPQIATIELYTDLIGTVEPEHAINVYAEAGGNVTDVFIKSGDTVQAGQVLCTIDTKQIQGAKNAMDNAAVSYQEARDILSRMSVLYQSGGIASQEYEGYANTAKKTEIAYKQAAEDYEKEVSYSNVTAAINGKVESFSLKMLDKVSAGDQLCVITGEGNKVVSANITENLRKQVKLNDNVIAEKSGNSYECSVMEIGGTVEEATGLYNIKIQMKDSNELSTGTAVKLSICSDRAEQALTVPVDSVYYENNTPYVYTFDNGTIHKLFIEAGIYNSERIEVKEGLETGEYVITTWNPELYEGAKAIQAETEAAEAVQSGGNAG